MLIELLSVAVKVESSGGSGCLLNRQEIETLLLKYNSYLLAVLRYKLNNNQAAEDILQDTYVSFLGIINKKDITFRNEAKLKNYLLTIAVNKVKDHFRVRKRELRKTKLFPGVEKLNEALDSLASREKTQEDIMLDQEQGERLNNAVQYAMEVLPEKYRKILVQKFTDNLTNKEIAVSFNLSVKAVESLLVRAKRAFKKEFEQIVVKENVYE